MLAQYVIAALTLLAPSGPKVTSGQLQIIDAKGKPLALCPLEKTVVNADIAGYGARVTLVQTFRNDSTTPIEAVYTFPLPADAAVDRMRMRVGERIVSGTIRRREEARAVYERARAAGQVASLLDQERPNIFTQSVANITPGAKVEIEISYVQLLKFQDGAFEFTYPMVVGPRYIPETVQDPEKISPPVTPKGTRAGSDIELNVRLDAGAPIAMISSILHPVNVQKLGPSVANITLARKDEIPNRDFILRYRTANKGVQGAFLTSVDPQKGGFFSLVMIPPPMDAVKTPAPKEIIFVMDQSGSQSGFPLAKSKELTTKLIDTLNPDDTFNVISFSNESRALWSDSMPNTPRYRDQAKTYVASLQANGGTELLKAVNAALMPAPDPERIRIVLFNTDGYVGNESEILEAVKKQRGFARMFTFGIGNSVNRFLIDAMSSEGKGEASYVTLVEDADDAVRAMVDRLRTPVLTQIQVKIEGVPTSDVVPDQIPDVFTSGPVIIKGRYGRGGDAKIKVTGRLGSKPWSHVYNVRFPDTDQDGSAIASLWAREKIGQLVRLDYMASMKRGGDGNALKEAVTNLALEFGLMSEYTSFVAVEERIVNVGGKQRTVQVPVEMPAGVSYEGIFGGAGSEADISLGANLSQSTASPRRMAAQMGQGAGGYGGYGGSGGQGFAKEKDQAPEQKPETASQKRERLYISKVEKALRQSPDETVEVRVVVSSLGAKELAALAKAGFKLDDQDKTSRTLFGLCPKKALIEIAQLEFVLRVATLS